MKNYPGMQTRKQRAFMHNLKRIGVAIFLLIFVASVVGVALVSVTTTAR